MQVLFPRLLLILITACFSACGPTNLAEPQQSMGMAALDRDAESGEQRPIIWVRSSERQAILQKIDANPAVAKYYANFTERVKRDMSDWATSPSVYLKRLPLIEVADESFPVLKTYTNFSGADGEQQDQIQHQLQTAVDCGVLYFLTQEEQYARYAADVLHTFVQAIHRLPQEAEFFNAGWVYTEDHLREAREIGAQLPIIYDFIQPWLVADGQVFDLRKGAKTAFNLHTAEEVFRGYAELAITRGGTGTNWPILEAASLVGNALALRDPAERAHYLKFFLEEDTRRQDALPTISAFYKEFGGSWPESFGYSQHVGEFLTYLFTLLSHHQPVSGLVGKYPEVVAALPEAYYFTYPGGKETILHGDGHRKYHPMLDGYEMAYHLGIRENRPELVQTYGQLIKHSIEEGEYQRFSGPRNRSYPASPYREPTKLLWFEPEINTTSGEYPLPVTDELPFAGITIQRNLSPSGEAEDGLMGYIGGGAYVHGHATGLSMELFGKGYVLGSKGGRTQYRSDIHENYYRIFASNNTVIVNGATESSGGWVGLGTDRAKRIAVEPQAEVAPVSPNFSFVTAAFHDTIGTKAEAYQERTLGIIRTTDTTGYYVDVFRSKSELPEQFHDYIYRNAGEELSLLSNGETVRLKATPDRYQANAEGYWKRNRIYRHPGWHFFEDAKTSENHSDDLQATFMAKELGDNGIQMRAFFPGQNNRSFTTATSPPLTEGPELYRKKRPPTLIVRQEGSAWDNPFAVVYEPAFAGEQSVESVSIIRRGRRCEGLVVKNNARAGRVTQLVLTPSEPKEETVLETYDLRFKGSYGVITYGSTGALETIYIGQGSSLTLGELKLRAKDDKPFALYIDYTEKPTRITYSAPVYLKQGSDPEQLLEPQE